MTLKVIKGLWSLPLFLIMRGVASSVTSSCHHDIRLYLKSKTIEAADLVLKLLKP
jgi:hypothetical protein